MPNHIESCWDIKGPIDDLEKLLATIKGNDAGGKESIFTPHKIIPMPKEAIASFGKSGANPLWYDWSVRNWGSKWEPYQVEIYSNTVPLSVRYIKHLAKKKSPKGRVYIHFQTAWSPITPVIEKISEMFPSLEFRYAYIDEGMGYAGVDTWKAGEIVKENSVDREVTASHPAYRAARRALTLPSCFHGTKPLVQED